MKKIETREDIKFLVEEFYRKIRTSNELGAIFAAHLPDEKWPSHLIKMTNFWEFNLLGGKNYKGDPFGSHVPIDISNQYGITQQHFAQWIKLWFDTLNENFEGKISNRAKDIARVMTTHIYLEIWKERPVNKNKKRANKKIKEQQAI